MSEMTPTTTRNADDIVAVLFSRENLWYDFGTTGRPREVYVRVEQGDWKHDHLRLEYLMKAEGFIVIDRVEEPSDEDCFTAEYTFLYNNPEH